jgi:hypothetical protein
MAVGRYGHTATLLPSGKVLIAGGLDSQDSLIAAAELYDPAAVAPAANFTTTGTLVTPRFEHKTALLPNGQVLLVGGEYVFDGGAGDQPMQHAELYDPASGQFASTGGMFAARSNHTLTLLGSSGKVLVVGGLNLDTLEGLSSAEVYQ